MKVKVKDLLKNVEIVKLCNITNKEFENLSVLSVNDNTQSSKLKNSLFVLIKGFSFDSHIEAENLAKKGVKFFVSEQKLNISAAYVIVKNTRKALSFICGNFYKNSIQKMKLICVLGTNGKTTTTYIIKGLLEFLKVKCGVIGTSGVFIGSKKLKETLTTPDPALLNKLFYEMYKANCKVVIIEVSAHAIALNKIDNLHY